MHKGRKKKHVQTLDGAQGTGVGLVQLPAQLDLGLPWEWGSDFFQASALPCPGGASLLMVERRLTQTSLHGGRESFSPAVLR